MCVNNEGNRIKSAHHALLQIKNSKIFYALTNTTLQFLLFSIFILTFLS